jgi:hypothetical protein
MRAWVRVYLRSLWIGVMGFCLMNAVLALNEVPPAPALVTPGSPAVTTSENPALKKAENSNKKEYTLLPKIRIEAGGDTQSKGIPIENVQGSFRFGLFIPQDCFLKLPSVSYAQDAHILSADRDLIYSTDVEGNEGDTVYIYRTGKRYLEPKTKEFLGYMAFKSAEAQILEKQNTGKKNNVVLQVKHNLESIDKSMRITKESWPAILSSHYIKPVLVENIIEGYIIDVWDPGITLIGKNTAVVLSVGKREGVSVGNLLEIYRSKDLLDSSINQKGTKDRPEIRVGRVLIYQVDEKLSLGVVVDVFEKIILFDKVRGEVLQNGEDECAAKNLDAHFFDNTCGGDEDCLKAQHENKKLGEILNEMYQNNADEGCVEVDIKK